MQPLINEINTWFQSLKRESFSWRNLLGQVDDPPSVLIGSTNKTGVTSHAFTNIPKGFEYYELAYSLRPTTANVFPVFHFGSGSTPTWHNAAGNYAWAGTTSINIAGSGFVSSSTTAFDTGLPLQTGNAGNGTGDFTCGVIRIFVSSPSTQYPRALWESSHLRIADAAIYSHTGAGYYGGILTVTAFRIEMSAGNIAEGRTTLRGWRTL